MTTNAQNLFGALSAPSVHKRKKAASAQVFKAYTQQQPMLLPPDLEELIPSHHFVRVVNTTIDRLTLDPLLATYVGGGTSAYHPKMMLKVLVYAYLSKVYSSRRIAKALREDVNFLWLAGMNRPDFRTLNQFRSGRLKPVIDDVFGAMLLFLHENKYIDLKEYFVDGTKLRADNNKHKVVWAKNTRRYKEKMQEKIYDLLKHVEQVNEQEQQRYGGRDLEELGEHTALNSEKVKEQVALLNEKLQQAQPNKQTRKAVKKLETTLLPKLEKYEQQEQTLAGRNSYAKTDPDATVFRMKDQQLLPAYNILMGTQHQFIVNYSFYQQKASEADAFIAHVQRAHRFWGRLPECVMGDSAYGSEENYAFLSQQSIGNYLKYNTFHKERQKKYRTNPYRKENFPYDAVNDQYHCPQGRTLNFRQIKLKTTDNGYQTSLRIYQCVDCSGCPVAALCKRGEGNRTIQVNPTLDTYRAQARANLDSERGIALRKQRGIDVEPVFGDIKFNQGYTRCRLRGKEKVNVELGLLSISHNIKKTALWIN